MMPLTQLLGWERLGLEMLFLDVRVLNLLVLFGRFLGPVMLLLLLLR